MLRLQGFLYVINMHTHAVHQHVFASQAAVWATEQRAAYAYGLMAKASQLVSTHDASPALPEYFNRSYQYTQQLADAEAQLYMSAHSFPSDTDASTAQVLGFR